MLSRPITSGAMLAVLLSVFGLAYLQTGEEGVASVQVVPTVEPETPAPEQTASVDPVADEESEEVAAIEPEEVTAPRPIVTINGRPVGGPTPAAAAPAAETPEPAVTAPQTASVPEPASETTPPVQTAIVEPPLPKPRPADLPVRTAAPQAPTTEGIDYDAIAAAAYGQQGQPVAVDSQFMSIEQREALAPLPSEPIPGGVGFDPGTEGLVAISGPSGETIWVYPEQLDANSSVTFETRRVGNEFGFIYDTPRPLW